VRLVLENGSVCFFKYYTKICVQLTRNIFGGFCQDAWCPGLYSNWALMNELKVIIISILSSIAIHGARAHTQIQERTMEVKEFRL